MCRIMALGDNEPVKRNDMNALRTSPYAGDERWYAPADGYSLYAMDKTNVEPHTSLGDNLPDSLRLRSRPDDLV